MSSLPEEKLDAILQRHQELQDKLAGGDVSSSERASVMREFSRLSNFAVDITEYRKLIDELGGVQEMLEEAPKSDNDDAEMLSMAESEKQRLEESVAKLENKIKIALLPRDEADDRGVIIEIRAGTGGEEAALFAGDLLRMYSRYVADHGWRLEVMQENANDLGGYSEVVVSVGGDGVFERLKFESGVHRVQRVPVTESGGRVHTSAATVAVLPEAEEVDVVIEEKDLRIDTFRAQGAGGQHVNTTDSAVRITHLPSGLVVSCQDEKSQHKNKDKAMKVLRARLYEQIRDEAEAERADARKMMVGSGDRSERIRTYNFPQGRVTDHRINLTLYKLDTVLTGESLDEVIDALLIEDQAQKLAAV